MGQMKWVYSLIENGQEHEFKLAYETALIKKLLTFKFDNINIDIIKAGAAIKIINDYNKQLDNMADQEIAEKIYWIEVENKLNTGS
jgi:hypothetical protein